MKTGFTTIDGKDIHVGDTLKSEISAPFKVIKPEGKSFMLVKTSNKNINALLFDFLKTFPGTKIVK